MELLSPTRRPTGGFGRRLALGGPWIGSDTQHRGANCCLTPSIGRRFWDEIPGSPLTGVGAVGDLAVGLCSAQPRYEKGRLSVRFRSRVARQLQEWLWQGEFQARVP